MSKAKGYFPRGNRYVVRPRINGKPVWVGTVDTEDEARALAEEFTKRGTAGLETVESFALRWMDDYPRPKDSTMTGNAGRARQIARDRTPLTVDGRLVVLSRLRLRDVNRAIARAYVRRNRSLLPALRAMFGNAADDDLIDSNPFSKLGFPQPKGRKNIVPITEAELHDLGQAALDALGASPLDGESDYGIEFRNLILFAGYTGLRECELFGLDWSDVDTKAGLINIRRRVYNRAVDSPKNGLIRTVALPPPAADVLRDHPHRDEQRIFVTKTGKWFGDASGLYYYWTPVRTVFESGLEPARRRELAEHRPKRRGGDDGMTFHELRHACAFHLYVTLGLDAEIVATQLGHTDGGELVRQLYGHRERNRDLAAIQAAFGQNVRSLRAVDVREAAEG